MMGSEELPLLIRSPPYSSQRNEGRPESVS